MFAQLLYLVVIISWAISLRRVILRASNWQIATWKGGNNRLTLALTSQTVHYVRPDARRGEYFGMEAHSVMSPSAEVFQCEMNSNSAVFTQTKTKRRAGFILSGKSDYTRAYPKFNMLSFITSLKCDMCEKCVLFPDVTAAPFKPRSLTFKLTR